MAFKIPAFPASPDLGRPDEYNSDVLAMFSHISGPVKTYLEEANAQDFFPVQSDLTDATSGQALLTGAFGLGMVGFGLPLPEGNLDATDTPTGLCYRTTDDTLGVFPTLSNGASVSKFGTAQIKRRTADEISQTYEPAGSLSGENIQFFRVFDSVAEQWLPWATQYSSANIYAPIDYQNGVARGGVMVRDEGVNGTVWRFGNGLQLCQTELTLNYASPQILSAAWTLPASFSGTPWRGLNLSNQLADYSGGVTLRDIGRDFTFPTGNSTVTFNLYRAQGAAGTWGATAAKVQAFAFGKATL
jgi:hypothetical protein